MVTVTVTILPLESVVITAGPATTAPLGGSPTAVVISGSMVVISPIGTGSAVVCEG